MAESRSEFTRARPFAKVAGDALTHFFRAAARVVVRAGRQWAAASRRAAREQLSATTAALEIAQAALAGEPLRELASRVARLGRELSGPADAIVFAQSAGAFTPLSRKEVDPALLALARRALASGRREENEPAAPSRAVALPLCPAEVPAGVLVLSAPRGKRIRVGDFTPFLRGAGAALLSAERQASKDRFLSFAAHELKTPLTAIKGYAYSLAQRTLRGRVAEPRAALVLERQAERLHGLLEEMLEVSRLETGRFVLHHEPCDLGELFATALRALHRLGGAPIELRTAPEPLPLHADRDRVERALLALLLRARSLGNVEVSAQRRLETAVVRLEWQGPALDEEARSNAFGPRWEAAPQERQGLGMSLHVAESVARLHGGVLLCEERAFVLELPLRPTTQAAHTAGRARAVLVVDDDEAIASMLADFLGENGFAANFATSAGHALLKLRREPAPDLLVLDLRMPEMDGRALLQEVRALGLRPRVVLLSADRDIAKVAEELNAESFVEKPFAPESLLAAVRRALPDDP